MFLNRKLILKILPNFFLNFISAYKISKNPYYRRIRDLKIQTSGFSNENLPYIKLENGLLFHGFLPTKVEKYYYKYFLSSKIKNILKEECIGVAHDISKRYIMPGEINDATALAKYYDFSSNDIVIEIGAFIGFYAMRAAEYAGHVIAIEAIDENYKVLKKNVDSNQIKNITPIHCAAWEKSDKLTFHIQKKQQASIVQDLIHGNQTLLVKADSVDNILENLKIKKVDFIRIQVNGVENQVLNGLKKTLKSHPKLLISAIYEIAGKPSYIDIKEKLKKMGYIVELKKGNIFAEIRNKTN